MEIVRCDICKVTTFNEDRLCDKCKSTVLLGRRLSKTDEEE